MNNSTINIIKASAGTGKTYRLAVEYVRLVLQYGSEINLDSILVLTFTRKATAEIRERIVEHLELLASTADDNMNNNREDLLHAIFNDENKSELSPSEKNNLEAALQKIKTDHQQLQVMTIDSYINNIFRNLINPQRNFGDFEIDEDILEKTLPLLYKFLLDYNSDLFQKVETLLKSRVSTTLNTYDKFFQSLIHKSLMLQLIKASQKSFDTDSLMYLCEHEDMCEERAKVTLEKVRTLFIDYLNSLKEKCVRAKPDELFRSDFKKCFKSFPHDFDQLIMEIDEYFLVQEEQNQQNEEIEKIYKMFKVCSDYKKDGSNIYNVNKIKSLINDRDRQCFTHNLDCLVEGMADYLLYKKFIPEQRFILSIWKEVLEEYDKLLYNNKRLTYNDVSWLTLESLLKGNEESIDWDNTNIDNEFYLFLTHRTHFLFIDEFQDTSLLQFFILKPIMLELSSGVGTTENQKVVVVGDEKQSIFGWRGGERDLLLNLKDILPTVSQNTPKDEILNKSYRSSQAMMDFINYVFSNEAFQQGLKEKNLVWKYTKCEAAVKQKYPTNLELYINHYSKTDENSKKDNIIREFVQKSIQPAWEQNKDKKDYTMAVLCRTNSQLETMQLLLEEAGIESIYQPSSLITEHSFVYPLVSLLKFVNYNDWLEFLTVLRSNYIMLKSKPLKKIITIINQSIKSSETPDFSEYPLVQTLYEFSQKERENISELCLEFLDLFLPKKNLTERDYININAFISLIQDYELNKTDKTKSIPAFLDFMDDNQAQDFMKQVPLSGDIPLQLLTIHKAKGLEFNQVFLFYNLSSTSNSDAYNLSLYPKYKDKTFSKLSDIGFTCHYDKILKYSSKKELFELAEQQDMLEEMNTLYVAFTRAKTSLNLCMVYESKDELDDIITNKRESKNYLPFLITKMIRDYLCQLSNEPILSDKKWYSIQFPAETDDTSDKNEKEITFEKPDLTNLYSVLLPKEPYALKELSDARKNMFMMLGKKWLINRPNLFGDLIHYYLSFLKKNLPEEHEYAFKQCLLKYGNILTRSEIEDKINSLKNILPTFELFPSGYDKVFTEFTIWFEGNQYRLDRLLLDTKQKRALILDYKTGVTYEQEQLQRYKTALANLPAIKDGNFSIEAKFIPLNL
jgi:ATP-dependent exoDNAse (exonuclease V) beta subunit